jgi:AcrR family transcriptional regulator
MMARTYRLKKRAAQQDETHRRIVEAAVDLHQTVGGRQATISAIAARAGVERHTVYRHFPDERTLLTACTQHYLALHPPPDPAAWQAIDDPEVRLESALTAIYAYHRATEPMMEHAVRDLVEVPLLGEVLAPFFAYWRQVHDVLAVGWEGAGDATRLRGAAIGLAIAFPTWQALVHQQGLDDALAVTLMVRMVRCSGTTDALQA